MENKEVVYGTQEQLLSPPERTYESLYVDALGYHVLLQSLHSYEVDEWQTSQREEKPDGTQKRNVKNLRARLVAKALVDHKTKQRIAKKPEEIELLGRRPAKAIMQMFDKILTMNGISKDGASAIEADLKSESEETEED